MTDQQCNAEGCYCPNTFNVADRGLDAMLCMIHLDYFENGVPFELKEKR